MIHSLENHLRHILDECNKKMLDLNDLLTQEMNIFQKQGLLDLQLLINKMMVLIRDYENFGSEELMDLIICLSALKTFFLL